ncbi:MAG: LysM peptidoglycan-binding domain-containing protein [Dehalococcoidia bacterium]
MTQEEYSAVCPYLGLADDADSHATYATEAHRCYRLPNPTRIATPHQDKHCLGANHVTCPVYLGEGVPQTQQRPPAAAAGAAGVAAGAGAAAAAAGTEAPVRGPRPGQRPRQQSEPRPKRPSTGALGPRPRSGGISMPVMTIGLFALAIVVIAIAFAIQNLTDDGDNSGISPGDSVATSAALDKTRTAQAGGTGQTPGANTTQTPGTSQTPTGSQTAAASKTPATGTPSSGSKTYIVKAGDFCGTIAQDNGITLQELLDANNMTEDDCTSLAIGQELKIP